ncbi:MULTISPECIES: TetR/AcrR family transcriptional regulator [unclassified Streptomyces]|uniref:TetR/AcrR family transcriptional regulator n=1 Tax=unclassified Streptomyces TaxID=2593676 RepID=UPI002E0D4CBD|nr:MULTISPECIES: helix-turn-helix domain-containing protein [unclassified Streptomyces]WSJ20852.1 TetR/AcrR family transcriptional regulator [Streptomyces sp. NBC_01324]
MENVAHEDLTGRARLRRCALELFAERGFEATSTRAVAAAAGLSPALVTRHFGSKRGLRAAVDEEVLGRIGEALAGAGSRSGDLMASLGDVSAQLFGADPVLRGYLRQVLLEDSEASADLFARLLRGARGELERLAAAGGVRTDSEAQTWAPFQILCLVLGPLLLERVMQPGLDRPMFAPEVLDQRSAANQRLLLHGLFGDVTEEAGPAV